MSNVSWLSGSSNNSLFSTYSSNKNTSNSLYNSISDLSMIKSGSYSKLTKAYYSNTSNKTNGLSTEDKAKITKNLEIKSYSQDLQKSLNSTVKNIGKIGSSSSELSNSDKESVASSLKSFTESYNKFLDSAVKSESGTVQKNVLWAAKEVSVNSNLLSKAGISVDKEGNMSFDSSNSSSIDMNAVKTLFSSSSSFVNSLNSKTGNVARASELESKKANNSTSLYSNSASYTNLNIGSMFESMF